MIVYQHSKCEKAIISRTCTTVLWEQEAVWGEGPQGSGCALIFWRQRTRHPFVRGIFLCYLCSWSSVLKGHRGIGLFQSTLEASRLLILTSFAISRLFLCLKNVHNYFPNKNGTSRQWQDVFEWNEAWNDQPTPLVLNIVLILLMQFVYIMFIYCIYIH